MELLVRGNSNFCLDNPTPKFVTYRINGRWSADRTNAHVNVSNEVFNYNISAYNLFNLISELKGCDYDEMNSILNKYKINFELTNATTIQELDLIKALFISFNWFDYTLTEDFISIVADPLFDDPNTFPKLFDDFIIDMPEKAKEVTLKDIYLIKEEYHLIHLNEIKELLNINLLSELQMTVRNKVTKNYFIPFTKPTYRSEIYKRQEVFEFYKKIINDRHICLNKHFNS